MVRQRNKAIQKVEDTAWVPKAIEAIRDLDSQGKKITVETFSGVMPIDAEQRLRKLTQLGWLHMSAERVDGVFVQYVWDIR